MFLLRYSVMPDENHPQREQLGEALVCCWIDVPLLDEADDIARRDIAEQHWVILDRESVETPTLDDYENEEFRTCHEQAMTDGEIYQYHLSPRYPVFWVIATVAQGENVAEAHYFLCGDSIRAEDEDVYDPDFWTGDRLESALTGASDAISAQGWTVLSIVEQRRCSRPDVPDELIDYYDEAEDSGACLVFVQDEEGQGELPRG